MAIFSRVGLRLELNVHRWRSLRREWFGCYNGRKTKLVLVRLVDYFKLLLQDSMSAHVGSARYILSSTFNSNGINLRVYYLRTRGRATRVRSSFEDNYRTPYTLNKDHLFPIITQRRIFFIQKTYFREIHPSAQQPSSRNAVRHSITTTIEKMTR